MKKYINQKYELTLALSQDVITTSGAKTEVNEVTKPDGVYYDITVALDALKRQGGKI